MRMALVFKRWDVDGFLSEIPADAYEEWQAFFALEPIGWPRVQMVVRRITWAIFQRGRKKVMPEIPFKSAAEAQLTEEQQRVREEINNARWAARAAADAKPAA